MADWLWLEEGDTFDEGDALMPRAIREYNEEHSQSALAFLSPSEYRQACSEGQININLENKLKVTPETA
jgi:hypothetical protein